LDLNHNLQLKSGTTVGASLFFHGQTAEDTNGKEKYGKENGTESKRVF
jgi:hypothetical protein